MHAEEVGTTRIMHDEGSATPYKTIAVGIGALLLVVALGYGLIRFTVSYFDTERPDPAALPKPTIAADVATAPPTVPGVGVSPVAAQASPAPAGGARLRVVNTENQGVRLRQRPSTEGQILRSLPEGTVVEVVGPDESADGITWRNVREPGGAVGWVAAEFVAPE
ncbi:MAG: SH3 domain-containing protein [Chloroflexota bacterium]|nr:SH3 domain-containing protein [Chloroflexota bacterium]